MRQLVQRPWLIVLIAALGHLMAYLVIRPDRQPYLWEYGIIARHLMRGQGFALLGPAELPVPTAMQEPFYPIVMAGFLRFVPAPFIALLAVQSAVWIGTAALYARLSARCLGLRPEPVWLVLALWPPHVVYALKAAPLIFRCAALALVLLAALALHERPTFRRVLALGGALGLAALVRATYQALPLLLLVFFLAGPAPRRPRLLGLAAAVALGFLALLPWPLRNLATIGAFVPATTSVGYSLMLGNQADVDGSLTREAGDRVIVGQPRGFFEQHELVVDRELRRRVVQAWWDRPGHYLARYARKLAWLWTWYPEVGWRYPARWILPYQVLWSLTLPLAILGYVRACRSGVPHPHWPLATCAFLLALYAFFFANLRLRFECEPLLVAYAVYAVSRIRWPGAGYASSRRQAS